MTLDTMLERSTKSARLDSARPTSLQELEGISAHEPSIGDYWRILQKRKWTIALTILVVLVLAAIVSLRTIPLYDAVARILISPQAPSPLNFKDTGQQQPIYDQQFDINTKVRILQSDEMAEVVLHRLNLHTRRDFAGAIRTQTSGGISLSGPPGQESAHQEQLIRKLQANLRVQQIPDTSLVEIKYSDPDPSLAAEVANGVAAAFIEENVKSRYDSTIQAADWLSKQLADLQITMESSQTRLIQYGKEHNIVGTDDKQNLTTEKLEELNRELTSAQSDRIQKESLYRVANGGSPEALTAVLQDPILTSLRQRQTDLQAQYALLDTTFGDGYTKVLEVKNQLNEVESNYRQQLDNNVNRIKNDYQTALSREQMLQAALTEQTSVADQLNENAIEYKVLKEEADSNRQLYDGLLQQLKEASLAAGLNSSNIRIVDSARTPLHPSSPNIPRNLEFALLVGLFAGAALAFGLEALDTTVRTPEQAESISELPTLAVIPLYAGLDAPTESTKAHMQKKATRGNVNSNPLISHAKPKSETAEAYRALRTSILLSSVYRPPRSILVTSSLPRDGKTMTSVNIAIVLAQMGKRVLLVEADMRRPSIHKALRVNDHVGLSNVLTGGANESDAIQATVESNLFVIPAGPVPPHPAELLSSSLMEQLLKKWSDEYDHVIVDSPPALSVTDPVLLSVKTDAVLLVVRSGQTSVAHVRRTCSLLQNVKAALLGIVLNAADLGSPDFYYYHNSYYAEDLAGKKSRNIKARASSNTGVVEETDGMHDEAIKS
jgi:polysaccharide biosynthesis transport protein